MPHPGEQHRENSTTANPFAENRPSVSTYTAQEIATLSSRLDKQLGPEYISTRSGPGGGKLHYIAADKVIQLANEVFGFNGWSSQIQNVQVDFVDENPTNGKITLGLSTIVRVTLRDGTFHEDIGYGHIENCKGKAAAFEKAKKEATTDALKRALRNFGNVLGNCLYDKSYLDRVAKIKPLPSRWDSDRLYRHQDYAQVKTEPAEIGAPQTAPAAQAISKPLSASLGSGEFDEEFGGDAFDESDFVHPDDVQMDDSRALLAPPADKRTWNGGLQDPARSSSVPPPRVPYANGSATAAVTPRLPLAPQSHAAETRGTMVKGLPAQPNRASVPVNGDGHKQISTNTPGRTAAGQATRSSDFEMPAPTDLPVGAPQGFVSGRSVDSIGTAEARPTHAAIAFNPHSESPSIRRTLVAGVTTGKSAPIKRSQLESGGVIQPAPAVPPSVPAAAPHSGGTPARTNFVNPSADASRRIGMPGGFGTTPNRGQYRPPSAIGVKRPPLTDMTNQQTTDGGADAKKPKVEGGVPGAVSEVT